MIKMNIMYYDRINVSGGIDVNKTNESKESDVCHYCYFLDQSFKFLTYVCNGCHDLQMTSTSLDDIAILNINDVDYRSNINGISESKAVNLLQNDNLTKRKKCDIMKYTL